jgi:protein TonB
MVAIAAPQLCLPVASQRAAWPSLAVMASMALHSLGLLCVMLWPGTSSISETPQTILVEMLVVPQPVEAMSIASPIAEPAKPTIVRPTPPTMRERPKPVSNHQAMMDPAARSVPVEVAPQFLSDEDTPQAGSATGAATGASTGDFAQDTPPDHRAAYLNNPKPVYPFSARKRGIQGTVTLKVVVDTTGTVTAASITTSSGHDALDEAAIDAIRHWRFIPAKRAGHPIPAEVAVPLDFRLSG